MVFFLIILISGGGTGTGANAYHIPFKTERACEQALEKVTLGKRNIIGYSYAFCAQEGEEE